jgi:transposase-like protein
MLVPRQEYSRELKLAAMREMDSGKGMADVARMYQLSPKRLETWRSELVESPKTVDHILCVHVDCAYECHPLH